eukprot:9025678-Ditylum_brightwellii.AAC.3
MDLPQKELKKSIVVNNQLSQPDKESTIDVLNVIIIISHKQSFGQLRFKVQWSSGDTTLESLREMIKDHPKMITRCIVGNKDNIKYMHRAKKGSKKRKKPKVQLQMKQCIKRPRNAAESIKLDEANGDTVR